MKKSVGEWIGITIGYCLFTLGLFAVLSFTRKLPAGWTILSVTLFTFGVSVFGLVLRKLLS